LTLLEGKDYLWYKEQLQDLIPEWQNNDSITVKLKLPSGEEKEIGLSTILQMNNPLISTKTKINLPSTEKCEFNYGFLENNPKIAILKVDGMGGFRENFELVGLENEYQLNGAKFFTMMKMLHEMGAVLIGTPSSQAGNNAGWILNYKLDNTGLNGWVACKYYTSFSDKIKNGV